MPRFHNKPPGARRAPVSRMVGVRKALFSARTLVLVAAVACALLFPQLLARVRGADGGASSSAAVGQRSAAELADEALMDAMEASSRRDWVAAVRGYEVALAGGVPGVIGGGAGAPTAKAAEAADADGSGTAADATAAAAAAPAATRELRDGDGALNNLAIALSKAGRMAESAARFEQALAAGGEGAYKPMINLARARQSGGDRAGALRLYERVVALRPACEPHRSVGKKKAPVAAEGGSGGGGGGDPANRGAGQGKAARKVTMGSVPLFCGAREPTGGGGGGGGGGQPGGGAEFLDAVRGSHLGAATLLLRSGGGGGGGDSDSGSDSDSDSGSGSGAGASRVMRAELHLKAALKLSEDGELLLQMASLQERLGRAQLADSYLRRCLRHAAVERSLGAAEDEVAAEAGAKARAEVDGLARAATTAKAGVAKAVAVAVVERDDFAAETAAAQQREQEVLAKARVVRDAARARGKAAAAGARERAAFVEATCASRRAALLEEVQPALGSESGGSWRAEAVRLYEHALGVAPDFTAAATRLRALTKEDEDDAKLAELARRAAATDGAQAGEGAAGAASVAKNA